MVGEKSVEQRKQRIERKKRKEREKREEDIGQERVRKRGERRAKRAEEFFKVEHP